MPIRARSFGRSVLRSPTEMPATVMLPCWKGSRPLTHLISVDLPEPEGPHTTTTSPLATSVEQSFKTWKFWYHLLTLLSVIIGASQESLVCAGSIRKTGSYFSGACSRSLRLSHFRTET